MAPARQKKWVFGVNWSFFISIWKFRSSYCRIFERTPSRTKDKVVAVKPRFSSSCNHGNVPSRDFHRRAALDAIFRGAQASCGQHGCRRPTAVLHQQMRERAWATNLPTLWTLLGGLPSVAIDRCATMSRAASGRPRRGPLEGSWRGLTVVSSEDELWFLSGNMSRGAGAYLGRYFGAFLLLVRWGAIWESEKDQWSYNDRNGYEHLHPPAEESEHQRGKRAPGDGLKDVLTL